MRTDIPASTRALTTMPDLLGRTIAAPVRTYTALRWHGLLYALRLSGPRGGRGSRRWSKVALRALLTSHVFFIFTCSRGERAAGGEGADVRDSQRDIRRVGPLPYRFGVRKAAVVRLWLAAFRT